MKLASTLLALSLALTASAKDLTNSLGEWYFWNLNTRIYAKTIGKSGSDPIVVIHGGFGAEHSYLLPAVEPLAKNHRFVLYDQRGSLRSPAESKTISIDSLVEDLEQLRKELDLKKLTLLTHSMGAVTAYAYLHKYPQNVQKIIFVSPTYPIYPGTGPDKGFLEALNLPADEKVLKDISSAHAKKFEQYALNAAEQIKREGIKTPTTTAQEQNATWLIKFASTNIYDITKWREMRGGSAYYNDQVWPNILENAGGESSYRELWNPFFSDLQKTDASLVFVIGKQDFMDSSYRYWPHIFQQLPKAKVFPIDRAGHGIWIDQPAKFKSAIEKAISAQP